MHEGRLNTGHDGLLDNFKAVVCRLKGFEALLLEEGDCIVVSVGNNCRKVLY